MVDRLSLSNDRLKEILREICNEFPNLCKLEEIGRSANLEPIWLVTITSQQTGAALDKPALWVDANIHGPELISSVIALSAIEHLCRSYGQDPKITRILEAKCVYIAPRVNPDGAHLAMAPSPTFVRGSTSYEKVRTTPFDSELIPEDVDQDGRILTMRMRDPNGAWKLSPDDERILVPRDPSEDEGGPYYRLLPEGRIRNFDGSKISISAADGDVDLNRCFPIGLDMGVQQSQPPEVCSIVNGVSVRPNICGYVSYHSPGGICFRPYATKPDCEMVEGDQQVHNLIGQKANELLGYKVDSLYNFYKAIDEYALLAKPGGTSNDWAYEELGVVAWIVEVWDPLRAAGILDAHPASWYFDHSASDDKKLMAWNDTVLNGEGFVDWYEFQHPELGSVELGGWDVAKVWRNPPACYIDSEVSQNIGWLVWLLAILPSLEINTITVARIPSEGECHRFRIKVVIENRGWLPTNVTQQAIQCDAVGPLEAELLAKDSNVIFHSPTRVVLGQLSGWAAKGMALGLAHQSTSDRASVEWVVESSEGAKVTIEVKHARAGKLRYNIELAEQEIRPN